MANNGSQSYLAQICSLIPDDAKPGETQLSVLIPDEKKEATKECSMLQVTVPAMALPRQTLVCTKHESGWEIGVAAMTLPEKICLVIPDDAVPGVTFLPIMYRGLEVTRILVPPKAKPGADEIQVLRPSDPSELWGLVLACDPDHPEAVKAMSVGASQAALRAAPLNSDVAFSNLVKAVTEAGGYVNPKIARGQAPPLNIPGILASEDISEGEIICRIPKELHVSSLTAEVNVPKFWKAHQPEGLPQQRTEECALYSLGAALLHDAESRAEAREGHSTPNSQDDWLADADPKIRRVWEAYMDQLLAEDFTHHPLRKLGEDPEGMSKVLKPSCLNTHLRKEAKCMHTIYRFAVSLASNFSEKRRFESGMFLRSMLNFQSRMFKAAISRSLVPVSDLLNHAPGAERSVIWGYEEDIQAHVLRCIRGVSAGQELFQSYGNHANSSFYRCYGFTMPPQKETSWCYSLWKDDVLAAFNSFVPVDSQANISEVHLCTTEVSQSLRDVLSDVANSGKNPAFFLRTACTHCITPFQACEKLRPVLEALKCARAKDPRSHDWWQYLQSPDTGLADDEIVRIRMSDYLCLAAYLEAISYIAGELSDDKCFFIGSAFRHQLRDYLQALHQIHNFK